MGPNGTDIEEHPKLSKSIYIFAISSDLVNKEMKGVPWREETVRGACARTRAASAW